MSLLTNPNLDYLIPFAFRVTVLPFTASLWLEARFGFALALSLIWHFMVYIPWKGLPDYTDTAAIQAYFIIMPSMAAGFALLAYVLRITLRLPWHLTPVNHLFSQIWRDHCQERDGRTPPIPMEYAAVSLLVSLVVITASWLPTELMVLNDLSPTSPAVFYTSLIAPLGATLLPLALWLFYGDKLSNLFGKRHALWNKFKAFLKVLLATACVNVPFALVVQYTVNFTWLWITAIIVGGGLIILSLVYYGLAGRTEKIIYEEDRTPRDTEPLY